MISLSRTALVTLLLVSCAQSVDFEFEAKSEDLSAKATITEIEVNFKDGYTKLSGNVVIKNTSLLSQNYSNMRLRLQSGGKIQERAYLDNLTSHYIDFDVVEIQPGETIELPAALKAIIIALAGTVRERRPYCTFSADRAKITYMVMTIRSRFRRRAEESSCTCSRNAVRMQVSSFRAEGYTIFRWPIDITPFL